MSSYQEIAPQIVETAKSDQVAFIQVYQHYGQRVLRFLVSRTGNLQLAEDLTQETFLTLLSKLGTYTNTGAPFSSWLLQIAMNHLRMHFRKPSNAVPVELDLVSEVVAGNPERKTEWIDFFSALRRLPEEDQNILVLKYVEDLSNQEIASCLNISPNTCGVQIHRALKQLQQHL